MKRIVAAVRRGLLALAFDESLYLFFAFVFAAVLQSSLFVWQQEAISLLSSYVIIPWSVALCVQRLVRADEHALMQKDTGLLTLMFLWISVPFYLRFGVTFNNVTSWYGHIVVFFAVYASVRERDAQTRARGLDLLCAAFAALSAVWGGMLLLCALTGAVYGQEGGEVFGVALGFLQSGVHYNITGMNSVCMMMMCLVGVSRRKTWPGRIAYLVPALMMALVIVLTQSRTARYSTLLALAAGTYGALCVRLPLKAKLLRHAAALAAAAAVLVAGYGAAGAITDAALAHYNGEGRIVVQAAAEETAPDAQAPALEARAAVDATFSDRTTVWKNLFRLWRENPKYLLIGNGIGRTGSRIVEGTIHEAAGAVAVHNTYLQLVADFGLIGAAITLAFFLVVFFPALRVFYAPAEGGFAGGRALCMMVVAILATGMMESQPLGANTAMNMMLYYALAVLCAEGRRLAKKM